MGSAPTLSARMEAVQHADAVVADGLRKTYPNGTEAVKGVSFQVRRGEIFGILGPNGAGKSTTIGMLGTLVVPTDGQATVDGLDVRKNRNEVRKRIGFALQEAGVDELATGREFLLLQGRLYGVPKATIRSRSEQLLKLFELEGAGDKRIKSYSGGMKRRIDLASALIHLPKILFLDEPTEGLDPRSRVTMWSTLKRLRTKLGTTIVLSTHYMEEAENLCDRIAIVDQGRIVVIDTPAKLRASIGGQSVILDYGEGAARQIATARQAIERAGLARRVMASARDVTCYVDGAAAAAPRLLRVLDAARVPPQSLRIEQPSLNDVYLKFTGRRLEEAEAKPALDGGGKK